MVGSELKPALLELIKVLNKGITMEYNAHIYYSQAALKAAGNIKGKKMYEWLSNFEKNHEDKIREKREEVAKHPVLKGVKLPVPEADPLMTEGGDFTGFSRDASDAEILKIAIQNERKAYSFYQRKLTHAATEGLRTMWSTFAREEERHIRILGELLQSLVINGIWGDIDNAMEQFKG